MPLAAESSNPFYGKPHTRNNFRCHVRLFDFCHGEAGKILKPIMQAAFNHQSRQLPSRYGHQLWRGLLLVLGNTPWSGGIGTALTPAPSWVRGKDAGRVPRMFNELAKSRS
jgi:hypothetical protein